MKLTDFYPEVYNERQGRPFSDIALDMETRQPVVPFGLIVESTISTGEVEENYTASDISMLLVDASLGAITITLPAAASSSGRDYYIKKLDSSGNIVTVRPAAGTELIDGEESVELTLQYSYMHIVCSGVVAGGSYWHIIGGLNMKLEEVIQSGSDEQQDLLARILIVLSKIELHAASVSGESVETSDIEVE